MAAKNITLNISGEQLISKAMTAYCKEQARYNWPDKWYSANQIPYGEGHSPCFNCEYMPEELFAISPDYCEAMIGYCRAPFKSVQVEGSAIKMIDNPPLLVMCSETWEAEGEEGEGFTRAFLVLKKGRGFTLEPVVAQHFVNDVFHCDNFTYRRPDNRGCQPKEQER